jgi:phosphoribosyl 1,2-cyclic phosphodiesterase
MKLNFAGTRGEIALRTRLHRMHSCLLVEQRVLIDCGTDWLGKVDTLAPQAILLTHAHADHAGGLKKGAPCEVYATPDTWQRLRHYPIKERRIIRSRQPQTICGITFEAFTVEHSLLAPAVGFRITHGGKSVFYVPDLVYIRQRRDALSRIAVYIGDGARITRPLVRKRGTRMIGHTSVRMQLDWCREEGIPCAVITHCGSEIVKVDPEAISTRIWALGEERGVNVILAHDGMQLALDTNRSALEIQ